MAELKADVLVLGAGMVGVGVALHLQKRGRNVKWAEDAVRKSVSVTEKEALGLKVIDLIADDVPSLLAAVDGRQVITGAGKIVLHTKGALLKDLPMGWRLEALKALSDPNIAFILMTLGTIGLLAELYNPGAILPGIVGAISLILAFYSLQPDGSDRTLRPSGMTF